jgi:predicted phosphohydrolase
MKINIISDLHLEHHDYIQYNNSKSDVLFLAGDICQYSGYEFTLDRFLKDVSKKYDSVYYIPGNHEYYMSDFDSTNDNIKSACAQNVYYLNNEVAVLGEYSILGGTLWTDLSEPVDEYYAERGMNDYQLISKDMRRLTAADTTAIHRRMVNMIKGLSSKDKTIVLGHHLPSYKSVSPKFEGSKINCAFATELSSLMNENIPLWVHGHTHGCIEYTHNGTKVICNPRGYPGENFYFNPDTFIVL